MKIPPEEQRNRIERMMLDIQTGEATPEQIEALRQELMQSQEARTIYLQANQLDFNLQNLFGAEEAELPVRNDREFRVSHLVSALVGAAAAAMLMFWGGPLASTPVEVPPLASLEAGFQAEFSGEAAPAGNTFGKGQWALESGIAQIRFSNGAEIVLDGHCGFEIVDEQNVILTTGKIWVYCPVQAHGFSIMTPGGKKIIDFGTEFGVQVEPDGTTDLHVFDGLVNVANVSESDADPLIRLSAGEAASWKPGSSTLERAVADANGFSTATDLVRKRLDAHLRELEKRHDLLLHFDFAETNTSKLLNKAPQAAETSHGRITGANRASGRSDSRRSLALENKGDSIQFSLERPPRVRQFTMALWINVYAYDASLSALLNTADWKPGATHFQITRSGGLRAGIHGGPAFETATSVIRPGSWQLVAVTWDLDQATAQIFCNGRKLSTRSYNNATEALPVLDSRWGDMVIGGHSEPGMWDGPRQFRGRLDHVMIFDHALTEGEMMHLFQAGQR